MKPRTLALLSSLIVLTIVLGASSLGFSSSLQGVLPSKQHVTSAAVQVEGNLLVRATYADGAPVPNATVLIRNLASSILFPIPYHTNSTGELLLPEPPGQYGVGVSNVRFRTSAIASVSNGNTTVIDIRVSKTIRATVFNELRTNGPAGFAPPWEQVVVAIPADSVFYHPGDTVFVQKLLSPVTIFFGHNVSFVTVVIPPNQNGSGILFTYGNLPNNPEIRADVVSSDLRSDTRVSLLWLTLNVDDFLSLDVFPGLQLVTYSASTQVTTHAD